MESVRKKNNKSNQIIKKEYIPIIIAVLLLIVMVMVLLIVIFYKDDKGLQLPDAPNEKNLSIELYDYESGKYNPDDISSKETRNIKVNYKFVTDYYKDGIILSNTQVDLIDNEFVIYSGPYGDTPYISLVNIKGELKWINKLDKSGYDSLKIKKIDKIDDDFYVFALGQSNGKYDCIAIKINSKGNEVKKEVIVKDSRNALSAVARIDGGFAITTDGDEGLIIYMLNEDFKLKKNPYYLYNDKNNIFHTYIPRVSAITSKGNKITMVVQYNGLQDEKMYIVDYDMDTNSSTITSYKELMKLANPYTYGIYDINNNFLVGYGNKVYLYNALGNITKSYDYSNLRLKEDNMENAEGETLENYISVDRIKIYDDNILIRNLTNSEFIYDLFDTNLKLKMRYVIDVDEYETKENVLLDVFYIDGKLYEVHSYGFETPSIMISIIG